MDELKYVIYGIGILYYLYTFFKKKTSPEIEEMAEDSPIIKASVKEIKEIKKVKEVKGIKETKKTKNTKVAAIGIEPMTNEDGMSKFKASLASIGEFEKTTPKHSPIAEMLHNKTKLKQSFILSEVFNRKY